MADTIQKENSEYVKNPSNIDIAADDAMQTSQNFNKRTWLYISLRKEFVVRILIVTAHQLRYGI